MKNYIIYKGNGIFKTFEAVSDEKAIEVFKDVIDDKSILYSLQEIRLVAYGPKCNVQVVK